MVTGIGFIRKGGKAHTGFETLPPGAGRNRHDTPGADRTVEDAGLLPPQLS
jgi:hypothetical protein